MYKLNNINYYIIQYEYFRESLSYGSYRIIIQFQSFDVTNHEYMNIMVRSMYLKFILGGFHPSALN